MLRPTSGGQTRQAPTTDAPALRFLRRACAVCQEHDDQGDTLVRNDAYRLILRDLEIPEDSQEEAFLRQHLEAAGGGYFSYLPMLRALGVGADIAPPVQPRQQAVQTPERGQQGRGVAPSAASRGSYAEAPAAASNGPRRDAELEREARLSPPSPETDAGGCDTASVTSVDLLEDEERFWNKRGPAIQSLFQQWDCQGLSNEAFMSQLQALLGSRVDISSPESDFIKLTNKHRVARNMKFASLTVALRQDARRTAQQRAGYAASSCAMSERDMSEVGGADGMSAAGKPSRNLLADADVAGRRRCVIGPDTYARTDAEAWRRSTAHWPPKDADDGASEASFASRSSLVSMADSAREEFIQRGRGHGNILTWGSDSRALTPEQKRRGRAMVTDPESGANRGYKKSEVIN